MGLNFNPNYYIDITDHYELKKEAILKHKSQDPQRFVSLFELMNFIEQLNVMLQKISMLRRIISNLHFPFQI